MDTTNQSTPDEEQDSLSKMPTDVLLSILEKLDLRHAVRLGVLSRQWRSLANQLPRLDLDIDDFLPRDYYEDDHIYDHDDGHEEDMTPAPAVVDDCNDYRDVLSEGGDKMADAVTALLASRKPSDDLGGVHTTLAMRFYLRHNYKLLGRLLNDAVAGGKVHAAELTITTTFRLHKDDEDEDEDEESADRSAIGYGRRFRALFDACPVAFGALTQLTMEKMRNECSDLRHILNNCTRLEKLCLTWCGPKLARLWWVRHARLKEIRISMCGVRGINLEWLPKLEHFAFEGWFWTTNELLSFGHVPCLTTVTLCDDSNAEQTLKLSHILGNTSISDLHLNFNGCDIWIQPESPRQLTNTFRNLKNLNVWNIHQQCGLTWTMFLLQSAPHLRELYIGLIDHDCGESDRKKVSWKVDTNFKHYSLARVTIRGFYNTNEALLVAFIRCLVETTVILEEICICEDTTSSFCESCGYTEPQGGSKFPRTDHDKDVFSKRIIDSRSTTGLKIHIQTVLK